MLAASVDGVAAIQLLLKHGATIELQVQTHVKPDNGPCLMCLLLHTGELH